MKILRSMMLLTLMCLLCASAQAAETKGQAAKESQQEHVLVDPLRPVPKVELDLSKTLGVLIEGVRPASAGYIMDFRYRVVDPKKAKPLFDKNTKPYLLHHKSGAKMMVPAPAKIGPMRNTQEPIKDKVYFIFFANPGKLIQSGDEVTVHFGKIKVGRLKVQ